MHFKEALTTLIWGPKPQEIKYVEAAPVVQFKVIEVKAPRTAQTWTKEVKDAIGTLPSHPGFIALMDRLSLQRDMLKTRCATEYHKEQRETDYLQAGVFWLGYLQDMINQATKLARSAPVDAMQEELEAFRQIDSQIERIGMDEPQAQ